MNLLIRLGNYISTKANFLKASVWMFGIPFGVFMAFVTSRYNPWVPVFSLLIGPVVGYIWGLALWHLVFQSMYSRRSQFSAKKETGT